MMPRILLIAYSYPPLMEAQSIRWAHLSRELIKKGHPVDVLTIQLPGYYTDGLDLVRGATLHRTYPGPLQHAFFRTKAGLRVEDQSYQEKRANWRHRVLRRGYDVLRRCMNVLLIPDLRTEWFPFALPVLFRLMNKGRYDIVISSHEPGVTHLLGLVAKARYDVHWIGDFSDPMVTFYTPGGRQWLDRRVQKALLKRMDRILVTNRRLKKDFLSQNPDLREDRVSVVSQGFDDETPMRRAPGRSGRKKLLLAYTGTFYRNERDPIELFKALEELRDVDLELAVAGRNDAFVEDARALGLLGGRVRFLGYLRYADSIRIQQDADVLVHLGNRSLNQVPGKIYEYLGARKPILAVLKSGDDESRDLILRHRRGVVAIDASSAIREALLLLWRLFQEDRLEASFDLSLERVDQYSWRSLSNLVFSPG